MNAISTRTADVIAAEINGIKAQTRTILLCSSIEIGRRLVEAKGMVEPGKWGEWIETSVDYSIRTAQNLMKIFEEYGADQIPLFGNNAKTQAIADLTYTQAVALLGVPAEDREAFIAENNVKEMTTRELQQAIKERDEAQRKLAESERKASKAEADKEAIRAKMDKLSADLALAKISGSQDRVKELEQQLNDAQGQVATLNAELAKPVTVEPVVVEKIPEAIEQELAELRRKAAESVPAVNPATLKFGVHFEALVAGFNSLLADLTEIGESDEALHAKYKSAVVGLLGRMSDRLG